MDKAQEKQMKSDKQNIAKRLKSSNSKVWDTLTPAKQAAVVNKYYELRGIDHLGIDKILDDNRTIRSNMALLLLGLLLGIFGNIFASILLKYEPQGVLFDMLNIIACIALFFFLSDQIDKWSADHLGWSDVLNRLLKMVEKKTKINSSKKRRSLLNEPS